MHHYFGIIKDNQAYLNDDDIHHLTRVLRINTGEMIEICFENDIYLCEVENVNPLQIIVKSKIKNDREFNNDLTLFFSLAKKDKIEFVIQKASELGASSLVLVRTNRSVVKMSREDFERKLPRYTAIAKEASQQSQRSKILNIYGVFDIDDIPSFLMAKHNFVAYEAQRGSTTSFFSLLSDIKKGESVSFFVGPEGGFDKGEIDKLTNIGFIPVSIGKRILRCETAAIYGLSVIGLFLDRL